MDAKTHGRRRSLCCLTGFAIAAGLFAMPGAALAGSVRVQAVSASRVRAQPVYETRARLVTVPAVYETQARRIWHEPVYEVRRVYEAAGRPAVVRRSGSHASCGRVGGYGRARTVLMPSRNVWTTKRVLVRAGYYETVYQRVCVRPATTQTVYEKVLVTSGHRTPVRSRSGHTHLASTRKLATEPRGGLRVALRFGR